MELTPVLVIGLGLFVVWLGLLAVFWLLRPRGVGVGELVAVVPALVRLLRDLFRDRAAPFDVRLVLVGLLAWILSPIDLIPEFIPILGPLDDVVVAIVALRYVRRRVGLDALARRWTGTPEGFELLRRVVGG